MKYENNIKNNQFRAFGMRKLNVEGLEVLTESYKPEYDKFIRDLHEETFFPLLRQLTTVDMNIYNQTMDQIKPYISMLIVDKKPIGFYAVRQHKLFLEGYKLFISPEYQGRGIGTAVKQMYETIAFQGIIICQVLKNNEQALNFNQNIGYQPIEEDDLYITLKKMVSGKRVSNLEPKSSRLTKNKKNKIMESIRIKESVGLKKPILVQ